MNVLTPSGYVDASTLQVGDSVCAFDENTGAAIVNQIETTQYVDLAEWQRWWKPMVDSGELSDYPPFVFYEINGTWTLNSEQSIWRNGTNVCHVRDLVVGDTIYDDADHDVPVTSVDPLTEVGWYRFDISGDHSYISDGLTLHNASRFWVTGTGTWDLSTTTHWAASTGGAGGQTAPGSADTCTFDGSSGGGTVTPSYGGTGTFQSITCGAFTGTIDWSINNNSVTLSTAWSNSGTGTRTINLGNGTWTPSASGTAWNQANISNLTFNANSSTLVFTSSSAGVTSFFGGASLTYSTISLTLGKNAAFSFASAGTTIGTFNVTPPATIAISVSGTLTITNPISWSGVIGTSTILIYTSSPGTQAVISTATGSPSIIGAILRDIKCQGGATWSATSSIDCGNNTGITITAPSAGGGLLVNPGMSGGMA